MFQSLQERIDGDVDRTPIQRYVELENVGHCPNHEAPIAVGSIASLWTSNSDRDKHALDLLVGSSKNTNSGGGNCDNFNEAWGNVSAREIENDEVKLSLIEKIITTFV